MTTLVALGGRQAGFFTRCGVTGAPINGIEDTTNVRWRVFNSWCVCSFCAPHAGRSCGSSSGEILWPLPGVCFAQWSCLWSSQVMQHLAPTFQSWAVHRDPVRGSPDGVLSAIHQTGQPTSREPGWTGASIWTP